MIGCLLDRDYQGLMHEKLLTNCPVSVSDVQNAHQIFGPNLTGLRGKTVHQCPEHITLDYVAVPAEFLDHHQEH